MRWSQAYIPTLREDPADAEAASHRMLVRGGFIRQLMAGSYSLLPLGMRVSVKVSEIIREEMNRIGGQEFLLPVVHPGEVWKRTGRWDDVEGILVKFQDRRGADLLLAMTHEEVFTLLAGEMSSYRDLPQLWYHLQTKFRDEPRPKSGLLRVREFIMKDSYSFDLGAEGLDLQFDNHYEAYTRIFERCGLGTIPVQASSGVMGGNESVEFMMESDAGEDFVAVCPEGDYAANLERAESRLAPIDDEEWSGEPERFPTPGIRTIAELADAGGTHVLLQGGVHPDLSLAWHEQMLRDIRGAFPAIHIHGYSPPEIWAFSAHGGIELRAVLERLRSAGLGSIPGGGAEILVDRVRQIVSPRKCTTDQWIEVMRQAHALGMFTTATMIPPRSTSTWATSSGKCPKRPSSSSASRRSLTGCSCPRGSRLQRLSTAC